MVQLELRAAPRNRVFGRLAELAVKAENLTALDRLNVGRSELPDFSCLIAGMWM